MIETKKMLRYSSYTICVNKTAETQVVKVH